MAEFSATFSFFQTEENLVTSPESLLNSRESRKQNSLEGAYKDGDLGRRRERELHHKNSFGTEERGSSDFIRSATFIHTYSKQEDANEDNVTSKKQFLLDDSQLSKLSVSKSTGSTTPKIISDVYLQYKTEVEGIFVFNSDFRHIPEEYHRKPRPHSAGDDAWTDTEFPLNDILPPGTTWVKAEALTKKPVLFQTDLRFCTVLGGWFDTSKFLVTFLTVMESHEIFSKVVQPACPPEKKKTYDRVVHFRFWYFGQWVDVYVDDAIPVQERCLVMTSHSTPFKNDIGITLAEKAYAKFTGSYKDMEGKEFDEFFHGLTGGSAVQYKFRYPIQGKKAVYNKLRDALDIGAYVFCCVKSTESYFFGLGENRAFSIIGTLEITTYLNEDVYLLKLRNIWGDFEWTGPWSHGSSEWGGCPFDVYNKTNSYEDCFLYMDVKDFLQYFDGFTIGSLIPDFAFVGTNKMDYRVNIYGEWRGPTAASFTNHLQNPKIQFTVSSKENHGEHFCDVGIILTQKIVHKEQPYGIHCSLLKVVDTTDETYVVKYMGQKMEYFTQEQVAIRQNLCPGLYILVPSTENSGQERQFLIRMFSDKALHHIGLLPPSRRLILCGEEGLYQEKYLE